MLPPASIKEQASQFLIYWMTSIAGVKVSVDNLDHGVDFTLKQVKKFQYKGKIRYMNSGKAIDVQLKCTTEKSVSYRDDFINFDLEAKNYNDMVVRQQEKEVLPLLLIVVILPENPDLWYENSFEKIVLHSKRMWYLPSPDASLTDNKHKVRVQIPIENSVSPSFFQGVFEQLLTTKLR